MRKNPRKGKTTHPDLFSAEGTAVFVPLDQLTPEDLVQMRWADFSKDEWQSLDEDVRAEILVNDKSDIDILVAAFVEIANREIEYYKSNDEIQHVAEYCFEPHINDGDFVDRAMDDVPESMLSRITQGARVPESEVLHEIKERLEDVENWEFEWAESAHGSLDYVDASEHVGGETLHLSRENLDPHVLEILMSLSPAQLVKVENELKHENMYFDVRKLANPKRREYTEVYGSFYMPGYYTANVNWESLEAAVLEVLTTEEYRKEMSAKKPRDEVVVVYEWPDGHFVADLHAGQLRAEGRTLGICVGHPKYNYKRDVEAKKIKIFSLRSPSGESKFCIEGHLTTRGGDKVSYIAQVKGKANRLPGFDRGKEEDSGAKLKKAEVERLVDFISALGVKPEDVRDMQPALRALSYTLKANPARRARKGPKVHCAWCKKRT